MTELRNTVGKKPQIVDSISAESLILVDDADREVGQMSKADCHAGGGVLHRAFSLFIFNGRDELLLQQRSAHKRLWPDYWSNSCCSHPRSGESMTTAIHRRLMEELGLRCTLEFLFKFKYQAQYDRQGAEHELCSVFFGRSSTTPVHANREEIADWRWVALPELQRQLTDEADRFTPWFKLEWEQIRRDHLEDILSPGGMRAWVYR
ncbi:MAG TPA: isopentenyl-diphosphate Delta-isomerase [Steroidobacteraceae bacterium]|nr:isopentenyl-diphosphate Delta-isomerase [Steroidobacteraceae bacterium]